MRTGAGFRMTLEAERRPVGQLEALQSAIEQRHVCHLDVIGQGLGIDIEAMVLARDENAPGLNVFHRMVGTMVAGLHLHRTTGQAKAKYLLAQTNAKERDLALERGTSRFNGVGTWLGVSRA